MMQAKTISLRGLLTVSLGLAFASNGLGQATRTNTGGALGQQGYGGGQQAGNQKPGANNAGQQPKRALEAAQNTFQNRGATPANGSNQLQPGNPQQQPVNGQSPPGQAMQGQAIPRQAMPGQALPGPNNPVPVIQPMGRPPLPPEQQQYVANVLRAWQNTTAAITRYSTKFRRWQYNPANVNGNVAYTLGAGELKYMKPDKGMFKVEQHEVYTERDAQNQPIYKQFPNQSGDWWLCDGNSVFKFERDQKTVHRFQLPPNMKGMQIAESPLPFVFGIEAEKMMQRYWVEPGLVPNGADGKPRQDLVVIDAYPKRAEDALNYQKVTVFLDQKKFLPIGLIIYNPGWSPNNPDYEQFEFSSAEVNDSLMDKIKEGLFMQAFIPNPPKDFKIVDMPFDTGLDSAPPNAAMQPQQAAQPGQRVANPNSLQPGNR